MDYVHFNPVERGYVSLVSHSVAEAQNLAKALIHHLRSGEGVAIHCRAGIGRSSVIAGCVLSNLGIDSKEAIRMLTRARRIQVPDTRAQEEWLSMFSQSVAVAVVQPGVVVSARGAL